MKQREHIAVLHWASALGMARAFTEAFTDLGHRAFCVELGQPLPEATIYFFFGPFGNFLPTLEQIQAIPQAERPYIIFWHTEGLPNLQFPGPLTRTIASLRTHASLWQTAGKNGKPPSSNGRRRLLPAMQRYHNLGDFYYAYQRGWIDLFSDTSAIYTHWLNRHGLPTIYAPFGGHSYWGHDLGLKRDIDVLWMGARATGRRHNLLERIRADLRERQIEMHVVDNVENPFVFGEKRTELLNRTKITLNLLRTQQDENFLRMCLAAPNGSLVISEPLLKHVPEYRPGHHYIEASVENMADAIVYYLQREEERQQIAAAAWELLSTQLTLRRSLQRLVEAVQPQEVRAPLRLHSLKSSPLN